MSKHKDGGPAFPACGEANINDTMGMSLRDWFAGQAIAGMLANPQVGRTTTAAQIVEPAYALADAMLAARSTGDTP